MSDHVRRLQLRMEELIVEKVMWLSKWRIIVPLEPNNKDLHT